jgi:Zn ribbon nucleic-acid-binding protein
MQPLSSSDLLAIWEAGTGRPPVELALVMLSAAFPQASQNTLADLTIGQRDACLLQLRALTFGAQFKGLAACPACGEQLEISLDISDLPMNGNQLPEPGQAASANRGVEFTCDPYRLTYHLPTSADLRLVTRLGDPELARRRLLEACVSEACRAQQTIPASQLPEEVLEAVSERINQAEPLANLILSATCPACQHQWKVLFDIVSFFWNEIGARAARLLREVHILASAYGWREADILALSPWRRQAYLEMIGV